MSTLDLLKNHDHPQHPRVCSPAELTLDQAVARAVEQNRSAAVGAFHSAGPAHAFGMMDLLGMDLQQISIATLIIALGLLVDDPVVAGDAMKRELARRVGRSSRRFRVVPARDARWSSGHSRVAPKSPNPGPSGRGLRNTAFDRSLWSRLG